MNQTCKVCGEPAAGFHFGAFTCEGCKSFFGRSYNNLSSISDCKNNGECVINKKNRTACKACRLRKCLLVGMSKSGSRYGRRSNWFKIHCLLQEQQQQAAAALAAHHNSQQQQQLHHQQHQHQHHPHHQHPHHHPHAAAAAAAHAAAAAAAAAQQQHMLGPKSSLSSSSSSASASSTLSLTGVMNISSPTPTVATANAAALSMLGHTAASNCYTAAAAASLYGPPRTKEELILLGLEEYATKHQVASPSVSSPDSHNSDSSVEVSARLNNPLLHLGCDIKKQHQLTPPTSTSANAITTTADGIITTTAATAVASIATPSPLLRKELPAFLPLPFPSLATMPHVMPPPSFLPPSQLIFPGYHPALYPATHQGLLKPTLAAEQQQQQQQVAAAVQHLFKTNLTPSAFIDGTTTAVANRTRDHLAELNRFHEDSNKDAILASTRIDTMNNNHILNGSKVAEELSKRFYLDAVLKSQRRSISPNTNVTTTKLPASTKHDHSISALVTPNSDSGRDRLHSRHSSEDVIVTNIENEPVELQTIDNHESSVRCVDDHSESGDDEELVVSMTPPRSPAVLSKTRSKPTSNDHRNQHQDNPMDLSLKTVSLIANCCNNNSIEDAIAQAQADTEVSKVLENVTATNNSSSNNNNISEKINTRNAKDKFLAHNVNALAIVDGSNDGNDGDTNSILLNETNIFNTKLNSSLDCGSKNHNNNNNNNNDENNENQMKTNDEQKRKMYVNDNKSDEDISDYNSKRIKLHLDDIENVAVKLTATTPLDLTTKV